MLKSYPYQTAVALVAVGLLNLSALAQSQGVENRIRTRVDRSLPISSPNIDDVETESATPKNARAPRFEFSSRLETGAGYSSNPAYATDSDGSFFASAKLALETTRTVAPVRGTFTGGYSGAANFFEGAADANNELAHSVFASWRQSVGSTLQYGVSGSFTSVDLDSESLLDVAEYSADVRAQITPATALGFSYVHQDRDVRIAIGGRADPESTRAMPLVFATTDLASLLGREGLPSVSIGYSHFWNLARGADEDFSARRVVANAMDWRPGADIVLQLEASYEERSGANLSSALGGVAARNDRVTRANLVVNHPLLFLRRQAISIVAGYEESRSNLASASYEAFTIGAIWGWNF